MYKIYFYFFNLLASWIIYAQDTEHYLGFGVGNQFTHLVDKISYIDSDNSLRSNDLRLEVDYSLYYNIHTLNLALNTNVTKISNLNQNYIINALVSYNYNYPLSNVTNISYLSKLGIFIGPVAGKNITIVTSSSGSTVLNSVFGYEVGILLKDKNTIYSLRFEDLGKANGIDIIYHDGGRYTYKTVNRALMFNIKFKL